MNDFASQSHCVFVSQNTVMYVQNNGSYMHAVVKYIYVHSSCAFLYCTQLQPDKNQVIEFVHTYAYITTYIWIHVTIIYVLLLPTLWYKFNIIYTHMYIFINRLRYR